MSDRHGPYADNLKRCLDDFNDLFVPEVVDVDINTFWPEDGSVVLYAEDGDGNMFTVFEAILACIHMDASIIDEIPDDLQCSVYLERKYSVYKCPDLKKFTMEVLEHYGHLNVLNSFDLPTTEGKIRRWRHTIKHIEMIEEPRQSIYYDSILKALYESMKVICESAIAWLACNNLDRMLLDKEVLYKVYASACLVPIIIGKRNIKRSMSEPAL